MKYTNWYICKVNKSEKTRNFIIERTAIVFNKKGYYGTSLSDITKATGLTKGSIYGNFNGKAEVAIEAFRYNLNQLTSYIHSENQKLSSAKDKLQTFINFYKYYYQDCFEKGGCAIMNTAIDSDDGEVRLKTEATQALLNWKQSIELILQQGIEADELKETNIEKFTCMFISLIEGSILLAKTLNKPDYLLYNLNFLEEQIKIISKT